MANSNPNTEALALGRGKRPKLDNETVCMRMSSEIRENLDQIAEQYGCIYGGKPWLAGLLRMIGSGELLVVPAPPAFNVKSAVKDRLKRKHSS
ncbi:hypothetical protein [Nostoc sp. ChiQUE01b]|uniref:hypothetical protein n=1 Tax=Nostoc sp. ChiQUE01b TaxID=3075376 RepID=UPI002AD3417D|nr:hypothetical protein [Nostoc sp. ChiQUE01b]MDZ8259874.1 hypothetical protein [Nostoc sp. ChiQUE01b]